MKKRIDIMVDLETLGTRDDSQIIQISAIVFDINTGEHIECFDEKINVINDESIEITGSTLIWWLKTNPELLAEILSSEKNCYTEKSVIHDFICFVRTYAYNHEVFLWGNGILFDNVMIKKLCLKYDFPYPIFYRNDRDMRTLVELASIKRGYESAKEYLAIFDDDKLIKHNALDDCAFQINVVVDAWASLILK